MNITKVTEDIFQLSMNLEDILFEGLWDIPNGTSVNSYIIKGEKTAIVDGVIGWNGIPGDLLKALEEIEVDAKTIEYAIVNHMEPDHSGWIGDLIKVNPNIKFISTQKGADLLDAFFDLKENIQVVKDNDTLDLGNGHVLTFVEIPNVHWPDTMVTYDEKTGVLFSCDAFGSFGSVDESNYDDLLDEAKLEYYEDEAVRYYSNIVASFTMPVNKAIEKCGALDIKTIAPGHGIVWRKNPQRIVDDYARYASYQKGPAKEEITVLWGSMYGMTEKAVNYIVEKLEAEGIKVNIHRVPQTPAGTILKSMWTSTGVVLAMPTYEYKMFPPMASILDELGRKKVHGRIAFRTGSYGWSGGAQKELDEIIDRCKMKWDFIDPVEFKGVPREEDFKAIDAGIKELVSKVREAVNN